MTVPIGAFPTQFNQGTIMDPNGGGMGVAQGLAGVLAQMQQQRENQFRMQELQNQMAQQQALQRYYEEQTRIQQDTENRLAGENLLAQQKNAQAGAAVRQYLQGQPGVFTPTGAGGMSSASTTNSLFQDILQGGAAALPQNLAPVFGGVQDENMVDAVKAVQEAQSLQPQAPEIPNMGKEHQYLLQIDPSGELASMYLRKQVERAGPQTVVNVGDKGETAFGVETGKLIATRNAELFKDASNAAASVPSMVEASKLVDKAFTGFGANQQLAAARVLAKMGIEPTKGQAADTQTMLKLLRDQTLTYLQTRALGSGTAVSDKDREFMERQSAADITMEPWAIKRIIRINMGLALERMVSTKLELQQAQLSYPQTAPQIQGQIELLDRKLNPIWNDYWKMMSDEAKQGDVDVNDVMKRLRQGR